MELLTDLVDRFSSIENRVVTLVRTLEEQQAIEESFNAADRDLRDASTQVGQLAASMKETAESLNEILVEFRSAVQVIREADPARVTTAVVEAQELIARQHAETQAAQQTLAAESAQRHSEMQAAIVTSQEENASRHGETQAMLSRQHAEAQAAQQTLAAESAQRHSEMQAAIVTSQEENASRHGETQAVLSRQSADTSRGFSGLRGIALGIIVAQAAGLALLAYIAFIQ